MSCARSPTPSVDLPNTAPVWPADLRTCNARNPLATIPPGDLNAGQTAQGWATDRAAAIARGRCLTRANTLGQAITGR